MATSNYYLYDPKSKKETLILLRFRYNSSLLVYSTRQKIKPQFWNKSKKRVKESKTFPQYEELNKLLNGLEDEAFNLYRSAITNDISVSNDYLKQGLNKFLKIDFNSVLTSSNKLLSFFDYFQSFIDESKSGKRRQKNGSKISQQTIKGYEVLQNHLYNFSRVTNFNLKVTPITNLDNDQITKLKSYYKDFYNKFIDFMYDDLNNFDNAVGAKIKNLRVFYNYLNEEKCLNLGDFHKSFYQPKEEISIIVLSPKQLNYLIYDEELEHSLTAKLQRVRDTFVFGCTVALRVSDLLSLSWNNIEIKKNEYHLNCSAKKTGSFTTVKLPDYCVEIINRYKGQYRTLLPTISDVNLNKFLKELGSHCKWNEPVIKTRYKRGKAVVIYKNDEQKEHFTFADLLTTHTMRRTAITTSLILGMPEFAVRQLSGHKPGSSEFHKYVKIAQEFMNREIDAVSTIIKNQV